MAEEQSAHRRLLESNVVNAGIRSQDRGQAFGFALSLFVIGGGFWLIYNDKSVAGLVAIVTNLVALVGVFILGRTRVRKELKEKADAFGPQSP